MQMSVVVNAKKLATDGTQDGGKPSIDKKADLTRFGLLTTKVSERLQAKKCESLPGKLTTQLVYSIYQSPDPSFSVHAS